MGESYILNTNIHIMHLYYSHLVENATIPIFFEDCDKIYHLEWTELVQVDNEFRVRRARNQELMFLHLGKMGEDHTSTILKRLLLAKRTVRKTSRYSVNACV